MNNTDFVYLIKRSLAITFRYRALWIFGFFLALCGGGSGGSGGGGGNTSGDPGSLPSDFGLSAIDAGTIIAIVAVVVVLILCLWLISVVVVNVARAALIAMVNQIELDDRTSIKFGFKQGFSPLALRVFLIALFVKLPLALVSLFLLALAASPLLLMLTNSEQLTVLGIILAVGFVLISIGLIILLSFVAQPIYELGWRDAVLNNQRSVAGLKQGYSLYRNNLKTVLIALLLWIMMGIAWFIVQILVLIALILMALLVGGVPGVLLYMLTNSTVTASIVGFTLGGLVFFFPFVFVLGLYAIFQSSFWTLLFRDLSNAEPREVAIPALKSKPETPDTKANDPIIVNPDDEADERDDEPERDNDKGEDKADDDDTPKPGDDSHSARPGSA